MTVTFHVMWMLSALGAIVFGAVAVTSGRRLAAFVAGFAVAASAVAARGLPDAPLAGLLAMAAVALAWYRPRYAWVSVMCGGMLGGLWPELLRLQGVPILAALPIAAGTLALGVWLARSRPAFAPPVLQDDALLGVLALGLALAALPGILDGWQSALTLNIAASAGGDTAFPAWLLAMVSGSLALGALHTVWSRR